MGPPRYIVLFGACLTQFTVIGMLFSFGLFLPSFEAELGWSRTFLSTCSALAFFMMGVLAMLGGRLSDALGPRIVLACTGTLYGLGFILMSQITSQLQLLVIFGTLIGLGLSSHDVVTLSTVARWFPRRRGIMSGVVKVGTAVGQIALPPVAALLIVAYGWREALLMLGITASVLLLIAALSMQRPPAPAAGTSNIISGASFAEARRGPGARVFWTLCATQFLFFPALMSVPLHLAVHGMDLGMTQTLAATMLSVIGAASIAGRLIMGGLVDRLGGKMAYTICLLVLLTSLAALTLTTAHVGLFIVVAIYGFGHGALFVVVSPTVAEYFGMRAHGAIFGTVLFFGTLGGSVGPILTGWVFDGFGSYTPAFMTLALSAAIALVLVRTLPRPEVAVLNTLASQSRPGE
ncbi:MCP family monocarboxylic acid transporter-like MFS transporter 13 [Primorskyibacter sedentarius]|uniref:MCP family monocarboxylic acid transporter-like MFS transporter 13 n=1 Tax=Primorskyibacter sedentarius TaxID=745311 RepID=A0A4R3IW99_9RHOB|nr:MFS transporter [Primorskyibacter sedentarius]TCS55609.1 MCP family monocarboxylic acid transporter-like MFS transporter 13 [Primorskyibacter sedentarius]